MNSICRLVLLVAIALATTAVAQPYSYMKLSDTSAPDLFSKRALIHAFGGRIIHEFPPNEFICEIDTAQFRLLTDQHAMDASGDTTSLQPRNIAGLSIARYCFEKLTTPSPPSSVIGTKKTDTIPFACGTSIVTVSEGSKLRSESHALSISRLKMFNANYLVGKTAVCIVLPQGPSGTHDWEYGEDFDAIGEVVEAYDQLSRDAGDRNVDVTWVYEFHQAVPVNEEPIDHFRPTFHKDPTDWWEFGWIDQVSSYLGVASEWQGLFDNANRLRQQYQTDWGLTYYVVKNIPGEYFEDSWAGYTKRYQPEGSVGEVFRLPFGVSVFNRGSTHETSDKTIAHETLHIYGASDEYEGADDCNTVNECSKAHGFLYIDNTNCSLCLEEQERCIMTTSSYAYDYCPSTIGQIGWSDSDDDGHPDAIDLNNDKWFTFYGIQPGDMVSVQTTTGAVVRNISITENKMESDANGSVTYFDCANYQSQTIGVQTYYVTINGGSLSEWSPMATNSSIIPNVYSIGYDSPNGSLTWEISNSLCYIDLEIHQLGTQFGDTVLLAKPAWNKFYLTTTNTEPKTLDRRTSTVIPVSPAFQPGDRMETPMPRWSNSSIQIRTPVVVSIPEG